MGSEQRGQEKVPLSRWVSNETNEAGSRSTEWVARRGRQVKVGNVSLLGPLKTASVLEQVGQDRRDVRGVLELLVGELVLLWVQPIWSGRIGCAFGSSSVWCTPRVVRRNGSETRGKLCSGAGGLAAPLPRRWQTSQLWQNSFTSLVMLGQ